MENLDLTTVDISDSEGSDGKGCACTLRIGVRCSVLCYFGKGCGCILRIGARC